MVLISWYGTSKLMGQRPQPSRQLPSPWTSLQWSINIPILKWFNLTNYWCTMSVMADRRPTNDKMLQRDVTLTLGNVFAKPSDKWFSYIARSYFDGRAVIPVLRHYG